MKIFIVVSTKDPIGASRTIEGAEKIGESALKLETTYTYWREVEGRGHVLCYLSPLTNRMVRSNIRVVESQLH